MVKKSQQKMATLQFTMIDIVYLNLDWQNDGQSRRDFRRYRSQENYSGIWKEGSQESGTYKL